MALSNALLVAQVAHARMRPKTNHFRYHVYYVCLALSEWSLAKRLALFSIDRFNLFSLYARDYGRGQAPEPWMRSMLAQWGITQADGEILLMTMPRLFGHAFNPVSFWFCFDKQGDVRAVLADVSNTFGERHAYLLHHDDQRPITGDAWLTSEKIFHVSPFIAVNGHYAFRFVVEAKRIAVWINHHDAQGLLITTSVVGKRSALSSASLLRCFVRYPLVTLKVVALIYAQALRLFIKGVHYHVKPSPPSTEISR